MGMVMKCKEQLIITQRRQPDISVLTTHRDEYSGNGRFLFIRNSDGDVKELRIFGMRVRNLRFAKQLAENL